MKSSVITAEAIGAAARYDKQLTIPIWPVMRHGVTLVKEGQSYRVEGAIKSQLLRGKFAEEHLLQLVSHCDGTKDALGLAQELGLSEDAIGKALALLWSAGVIEEQGTSTVTLAEEYICLLSRLGDSTGANSSWHGAAERMASQNPAFMGDTNLAASVSAAWKRNCAQYDSDSPATLVVFFSNGDNSPERQELAKKCWVEGIPFLNISAGDSYMGIGPYIDPEFSPCLDCGLAGIPESGKPYDATRLELIAGLALREITSVTTRAMSSMLPLDSGIVDLETLKIAYFPQTTLPGCSTCSCAEGATRETPVLSAQYESGVAIPPREFVDQKGHLAHYQSSNLQLQFDVREWPSCEHVSLPQADLSCLSCRSIGDGPSNKAHAVTVKEIAAILAVSAGLKRPLGESQKVKRWTAAGGNLGSVTAYVIIRDAAGLLPGTYVYLFATHELARITEEVDTTNGAPATLIFTTNVNKVAQKYGAFALRVGIQDSGCAVVSAREVAHGHGISFVPAADWNDDALQQLCGAVAEREPITSVIYLGSSK